MKRAILRIAFGLAVIFGAAGLILAALQIVTSISEVVTSEAPSEPVVTYDLQTAPPLLARFVEA
jgi:hypothetical protein